MIFKSYLAEENLSILKNKITLFYGENFGMINDFKNKICCAYKGEELIRYTQDDVLKDKYVFFLELKNVSLFETNKIFFIQEVSDKFLNIIEELMPILGNNKIFLFSGLLEKRSKLRSFFEKDKSTNIIACYKDNDLNLKKQIIVKLKDFSGVTTEVINLILENCGKDRTKLNNEIDKIKTYFIDKNIIYENLIKLLNNSENEDFNEVKDYALNGNIALTNKLLNSTFIEKEKVIYYLTSINKRLLKLKEVLEIRNTNYLETIDNLKPPIFWKDKPNFISQVKLWNLKKLNKALKTAYNAEISIKSNSNINNELIIKKLLIDVCNLANAA